MNPHPHLSGLLFEDAVVTSWRSGPLLAWSAIHEPKLNYTSKWQLAPSCKTGTKYFLLQLLEQWMIISPYSNDWLVFIILTQCVYCAVRTGSLYIIQVTCFVRIWEQTAIISLYSINWLVCITETGCVYCAVRTGSLYIIQVMCFVWIWEQTAIISLYSINCLVCITETECVYCAVRTGSLYIIEVCLRLSKFIFSST